MNSLGIRFADRLRQYRVQLEDGVEYVLARPYLTRELRSPRSSPLL